MRAVLQRVRSAKVVVEEKVVGQIGYGLLILLGVETTDSQEDLDWLVSKIVGLRIFNDNEGAMNLSVNDIDGDCLVVSQFTLYANCKKGKRPSYTRAAKPVLSQQLYNEFVSKLRESLMKQVETGLFGADMQVSLLNDGPVTIILDSKQKDI